jgi:hypothetical protein
MHLWKTPFVVFRVCSFKNNQKHGQGVGVMEGAWIYKGAWRKGSRWGSGSCSYLDGSMYEGQWKADERSGSGTLRRPDGYCYNGEWLANKQHGMGESGVAVWAIIYIKSPFMGAWLYRKA